MNVEEAVELIAEVDVGQGKKRDYESIVMAGWSLTKNYPLLNYFFILFSSVS